MAPARVRATVEANVAAGREPERPRRRSPPTPQQIEAQERPDLDYQAWDVYYGARLLPEGSVLG